MLLLCACAREKPPPPATPAEVRTVTVSAQPRANVVEVPGRLQAVRAAEVRARVDGIVEKRLYQEGSDVREGQPLFEIDPKPLRAQLSAARAAVQRALATEANARKDVQRYQGLVAKRAISQQEYDSAEARARTAGADVAQAQAQLEVATLNLGYTQVKAPISGRAGRAYVTEGALVSGASATLLTIIEQIDPIHVNLSQSSSQILGIRKEIAAGTLEVPGLTHTQVRLLLEDGSEYPHVGHLNFFDLRVDEATGTTALRAEFANAERQLLPGQFVRARIAAGVRPSTLVVPQRAVTVTPTGASVMVVGANDVADTRAIKIGALQAGLWTVLEGLREGERVIIDGLQKVRPGKPVRVAPEVPETAAHAIEAGDAAGGAR